MVLEMLVSVKRFQDVSRKKKISVELWGKSCVSFYLLVFAMLSFGFVCLNVFPVRQTNV